jgi:phage shock protein A
MPTWLHLFRKTNEYAKTAAEMKIDEHADPRVQLEQAIGQAQEQDETLRSQAAVVIGHQKQEEARLQRKVDKLADARASAAQALQMAESDPEHAEEFQRAAEQYAAQVVTLQAEIDHEEQVVEQATAAAQEAHEAIREHAEQLQAQLRDRNELLSELDQTEMQETLQSTMGALRATANTAVPTMDQVRAKIEARHAKVEGYREIAADSPDHALAAVRHAAVNAKATAVLDEIRAQALPAGPAAKALEAPK